MFKGFILLQKKQKNYFYKTQDMDKLCKEERSIGSESYLQGATKNPLVIFYFLS